MKFKFKLSKKLLSILGAVVLLVEGCLIVSGAAVLENINAQLNKSIKIIYNDIEQNFLDEKGNRVYPISYAGSTYLPVRAVSNMFNEPIAYNAQLYQITIGADKNKEAKLSELSHGNFNSYFYPAKTDDYLTYKTKKGNESFSECYIFEMKYNNNSSSRGKRGTFFDSLGYNTLELSLGIEMKDKTSETIFDSTGTVTAKIFDQDGSIIESVDIKPEEIEKRTITLPKTVTKISIEGDHSGYYGARDPKILVYDAKLSNK